MTHPSSNRLTYTQVFEETFIFFKKYLKEITILSITAYSLSSCIIIITNSLPGLTFSFITLFLVVYLFFIFQLHENKKTVDLDRILFQKKYHYQLIRLIKPFVLLSLFLVLLSFVFLIPAIIFAIFWSFWELIALEKNLSPKDILEYSKKLVSGNWWYLFVYFVITFFISNLPYSIINTSFPNNPFPVLLSNLSAGFLTSFFIIGFFFIYRNLQKISH